MIRIEAVVRGEIDVPPFTKLFEFTDEDEPIFLNVVEMVKDKLSRNLKLNTHEALLTYCAYLVSETRANKSESDIANNVSKVLTRNNVLIGVPETLREITFHITVDNLSKNTIRFIEPIPTSSYIMTDNTMGGCQF